jgi:hypothetical protein
LTSYLSKLVNNLLNKNEKNENNNENEKNNENGNDEGGLNMNKLELICLYGNKELDCVVLLKWIIGIIISNKFRVNLVWSKIHGM